MALTALSVKNAKPKAKPYKLGGRKRPISCRHARVAQSFGGSTIDMGEKRKTLAFGKWNDIELAQARERRDAARKKLAEGIDPGAPPSTNRGCPE